MKESSLYVDNCELQKIKYHRIVLAVGNEGACLSGGRWDVEEAQLRLPTRQPNSQRVLFLSLELGFSPASRSLSLS